VRLPLAVPSASQAELEDLKMICVSRTTGFRNIIPCRDARLSASTVLLVRLSAIHCTNSYFAGATLNPVIRTAFVLSLLTVPAFAQELVDPTTVAPEYREVAEKRRAEQLKQQGCAHRAVDEKVMPRDRTAFLLRCEEVDARK